MRFLFTYILAWLLNFIYSYAQNPSSSWVTIGEYNGSVVEVTYSKGRNACYGGDTWNVQYRISEQVLDEVYVKWQVIYVDCDGSSKLKQFEVDLRTLLPGFINEPVNGQIIAESFAQNWIRNPRIESRVPKVPVIVPKPVVVQKQSVAPDSIIGPKQVYPKDRITLVIAGGELQNDDKWMWYKDSCGVSFIGTGTSISVNPEVATSFFVRAEGDNGPTTDCISHSVNITQQSIGPTGIKIEGSTSCYGNELTLSVEGGRLGLNAKWVWYKGGCGSERFSVGENVKVRVGEGEVRYFVRAEGQYTSDCASVAIQGKEKVDLVATIRHVGEVCAGEQVKLELNGNAAFSGELHWYKDSCGGELMGVGNEIFINPLSSARYFVRTENECSESICASTYIIVLPKSSRPRYINAPTKVVKGAEVTISVGPGGSSGYESTWIWYDTTAKSILGTGDSIRIKLRKPVAVELRSSGPCEDENQSFGSILLTPENNRIWDKYNSRAKYSNKIMHKGFQLGLESNTFSRVIESTIFPVSANAQQTNRQFSLSSFGLTGGFTFYPIHRNYFGIGFSIQGFAGIPFTDIFSAGPPEKTVNGRVFTIYEDLTHFSGRGSIELTLGGGALRLLGVYRPIVSYIDYKRLEVNSSNVRVLQAEYNLREISQQLGLGIRMGRITTRYVKSPAFFDIQLLFQDDFAQWSELAFSNLQNVAPSTWNAGIEIRFTSLNKMNLSIQMIANSSLNGDQFSLNNPHVVANFGLQFDRFY